MGRLQGWKCVAAQLGPQSGQERRLLVLGQMKAVGHDTGCGRDCQLAVDDQCIA